MTDKNRVGAGLADGRLKVIITGATGFVGHRLCGSLRQNGTHVMAAVRTNITPDVLPGVKQVVAGNIDSNTNWQEALAGIDCVVHLAARVHVMREKSADPHAAFHNINVAGTLNLARQAQVAGVKRFVYLSSIKVNGEIQGIRPFLPQIHLVLRTITPSRSMRRNEVYWPWQWTVV